MRCFISLLLVGAAAAAGFLPPQQVLEAPKQLTDSWAKPLEDLQESLKSLRGEAKDIWDDVTKSLPGSLEELSFFSPPKKHSRRPDHHWDNIIRGSDIQGVWMQNEEGEMEREIDGRLEAYSMRSKRIDPSALGVDPGVKQYSGYLDDKEEDKHLFYCELSRVFHDQH